MNVVKLLFLMLLLVYGCNPTSPVENNKINETKDTIYVGGDFTIIDNENARDIAKWDGKNWSALGKGIKENNAGVGCMSFYKGELFIGGVMDSIGGTPLKNIAKWDGKKWSDVGGGINGKVNSMVVYKNMLYVAGWFSSSGGIHTDNIARWDGNNWLTVGKGFSDEVYALCIYNDKLIAGGWFTKNRYGNVNADNIAQWDGVKWDSVGSGMQLSISGGSWVMALTVFNNELYASGNFARCGDVKVSNIAKWNGKIWQPVGTKNISNRTCTAIGYKNELHVAGESDTHENNTAPYYAVWNGESWNFNLFSFDGIPCVVYSKYKSLYIGGTFHTVNGNLFSGICKWDGNKLQNLGQGINGNVFSIISK